LGKANNGIWSPDGNYLVLTTEVKGKSADERNRTELQILDLRTSKLSLVPGSQGTIGGFWPTQGALVAATEDLAKLMSFDFKTQKWTDLLSGQFVDWTLSPDEKYLYYETIGTQSTFGRIRLYDHKVETITSLGGLRRVVDPVDNETRVSVAPDGSPVITRDIGTQEVYAIDVKWP
jgi:hypothetical protein